MWNVDLCRDSWEEARNLLESAGTNGSFQRPEASMVAVSVSLLCPDLCPADLCLNCELLSKLKIAQEGQFPA
jgi:hypothetical protein